MMFAEASNSFMGAFIYALLALLGGALSAASLYFMFRKPNATVAIEPQPLEVRKQPKRFNHELSESRHREVTGRLDGHDAEIDSLWTTLRAEDKAIRETHAQNFAEVKSDISGLAGTLEEVNANVRLILADKIKKS